MTRHSQHPICPVWTKPFKTESRVLQHLNQPSGRCAALKDDLTTQASSHHLAAPSEFSTSDHGQMIKVGFNDTDTAANFNGTEVADTLDPATSDAANGKHR